MITQQNITFAIAILTSVFVVYNYFRNPQIKSDKIEDIFDLKLRGLETQLNNLKDNHIHTLETKIDGVNGEITNLKVELGKLATIIDERIPRSSAGRRAGDI